MRTFPVSTDSIQVGVRHRALSEDAVLRLKASMHDMGLRQPISIRVSGADGTPFLVAGRHRLEAARRLGWASIDCVEINDDAVEAELWEIAENLHRLDLTKEQRDEHIRRYAELLEVKEIIVPQNAEQMEAPARGRPKSTVTKVAEATGLSDDTVRRALKNKPKSKPKPPVSAAGRQLATLRRAWRQASKEVREIFVREINERIAA